MRRLEVWLAVSAAQFLLAAAAGPAGAEVLDAAANGFTTCNAAVVPVDCDRAYEAVVLELGQWWDPAHSFFGEARDFRVDATPGGGWFEIGPDGRWAKHLEIVQADPGRLLRLRGGLGPLQGMAVAGALTWEFLPEGEGTRVVLTYAVGGYGPRGLDALAPAVDRVLGEQLRRLQAHLGG